MSRPLRMGALFAGYEGLGMGLRQVLNVELAWVSEIEPAPSKILAHHYPHVPNHGDMTAIDWTVVEPVDVITGGFPCQDVSTAGKRAGLRAGTRSGLWSHMAEAVDQLRPRLVVIENVRGLLNAEADSPVERCPWCVGDGPESGLRALGAVLGDLADIGYDASWCGLRAADVGAPHGRFRVFVVAWPAADPDDHGQQWGRRARNRWPGPANGSVIAADTERVGHEQARRPAAGEAPRAGSFDQTDGRGGSRVAADARGERRGRGQGVERGRRETSERIEASRDAGHGAAAWGDYEPAIRRWGSVLGRVAPPPTETGPKGGERLSPMFVEWLMGLPDGWVTDVPGISRNDQLKALGNGVVPQQAAAAIRNLLDLSEVAA